MSDRTDLLRFEFIRVARDRSLLGLIFLFALVTGYAAWNGSVWAEARREAQALVADDTAAIRERFLARMRAATQRDPLSGAAAGMPMGMLYGPVLPVHPLAPLSLGQADGYPYAAKLHALRTAHSVLDTDSLGVTLENPATLAAGRFDLAFVIVFLLPLFLLAGAYDLWTQERDLGTADFVLSQPRSLASVLAMKLLVRSGLLLLMFVLIVLLALAAMTASHGLDAEGLLQASAVLMLYGSFWALLALAVNLRARHSAQAAIACGGAWLALLLFVPAILSATKDFVSPLPSRAQYVNELRAVELSIQEDARQRRQTPTMQNTASGPRQSSTGDRRSYLARAEAEDQRYAPIVDGYRARIADHVVLGNALRVLSPSVAAQDALDRIAGTHADRALAFQDQVLSFLDELRHFAAQYRVLDPTMSIENHLRNMPEFHFDERSAGANRGPLLTDFATLLVFDLILIVIIAVGLRRRWIYQHDIGEQR